MSLELFGRDVQIAAVRQALVQANDAFTAVVVAGEAGIGKSALWELAVAEAEAGGYTVMQARSSESETRLSYGGLSDLLANVDDTVLAGLAVPQRRALATALLRDDSGPIDPRAAGTGFLATIRILAARRPVLLAVDDDQWLDPASTDAVVFALRRLRAEHILVLLARRPDSAAAMYGMDGIGPQVAGLAASVVRLDLGSLAAPAILRLLASRAELPPLIPRLGRRVCELSGGNPFYALEIAAALSQIDQPVSSSDDLPVPKSLSGLLSARLDAASPGARSAVLVTSFLATPRVGLLRQALATAALANVTSGADSSAGIDDAVDDRLLLIDGDHVRLAHPLIGAVARAQVPAGQQRRLHQILAGVEGDAEAQARHLALSRMPPDAAIAAELARVADVMAGRGAACAAAELTGQAWRFTPPGSARRDELLVLAATRYDRAGLFGSGLALLRPEIDVMAAGPLQARARFYVARMSFATTTSSLFTDMLAAADPFLRAEILAFMVTNGIGGGGVPMTEVRTWAAEAVEISVVAGDRSLHAGLVADLGWVDALLGIDPEPVLGALADANSFPELRRHDEADRVRAMRAMWRGDIQRARDIFAGLLQSARAGDEEWSAVIFTLHLFEAAIRVGDWAAAARLRDELLVLAAPFPPGEVIGWRVRASVAAGTGDRQLCDRALLVVDNMAARRADGAPISTALHWHQREIRRAAGLSALLDEDAQAAVRLLGSVVKEARTDEYRDPGTFPVGADLIEALIKSGQPGIAAGALGQLEAAAVQQRHPWALAAVSRARGLLLMAVGDQDEAAAALEDAVHRYRVLALPFDEARTVLALGILRRKLRQVRQARSHLSAAAASFEQLAAPRLASKTRDELTRLGGRRSTDGLTSTERRIVDLVVAGYSNRQVADRLFVTVGTVEAHLTRIYAKLGVRSRTQLARNVRAAAELPAQPVADDGRSPRDRLVAGIFG